MDRRRLDIEDDSGLLKWLSESGLITPGETPAIERLTGGVSGCAILVRRRESPAIVIKQALSQLRVATEWKSDPARIHREALAMQWLPRLADPIHFTQLLAEDTLNHVIAMSAVPDPSENWKTRLLAGKIEIPIVQQFAKLLASIHRHSHENLAALPVAFRDQSFFDSLRLNPYYEFTAAQVPEAAPFLQRLIRDCKESATALVHGDYSPKNVLLHQGNIVLLDHEVAHIGDPGFDLGFALTHFISKAEHLPALAEGFMCAAMQFWNIYRENAGPLGEASALEARAVRHTLACMLARVQGRSPLEYLRPESKARQRNKVLEYLTRPPLKLAEFLNRIAIQR